MPPRARGRLSLAIVLLALGAARTAPAADEPAAAPPLVLLVLDGLPESSLLAADGSIDEELHPHFAALAATATRFTAATTVAVRTADSLPALLTGRLPTGTRRLPIAEEHASSLFTLLGDCERNVVETESVLLDDGRGRAAHEQQLQQLWSDRVENVREDASFRRFVGRIAPAAQRARAQGRCQLHFAHVRLPRAPVHFDADGVSYRPYRFYEDSGAVWSDEAWWPEEAWRRHALQLRFTDALLGELVAELRRRGLFDPALIVVTALSGASFWPGEAHASLEPTAHAEDVLHVPLLVKRPGQTAGAVDPRPAEAIDVLPTIASELGRKPDVAVDGCALFALDCPPRTARRVMRADAGGNRARVGYPIELTDRRETLARRLATLGSGAEPRALYAFGPFAALVGTRVDAWPADASPAGSVRPDPSWLRSGRGARGPRVVAGLALAADAASPATPYVAIARAGVIETVVPAPVTRDGRVVAAMIPVARDAPPDPAALSLHLVSGEPASPRLRPLSWSAAEQPRRRAARPPVRRPRPAE